MELDRIYNIDAFDGLKQITSESIDLVLTDPPYGTTQNAWDKAIDLPQFWQEMSRIIKPHGAILIWSQMPFTIDLVMGGRKLWRYEWIIEKANATGFLNASRMPMKAHESIQVFYKHLPTYNAQLVKGKPYVRGDSGGPSDNYGKYHHGKKLNESGYRKPRDVLKTAWRKSHGHTLHPTQKPLSVTEYMIKTYSNEGDTVLDCFAGSGSTPLAAKHLNRHYIGFEKEKDYWQICQDRLLSKV